MTAQRKRKPRTPKPAPEAAEPKAQADSSPETLPEPLHITIHNPDDDAVKDLDFDSDLDALDTKFKRAERVITVDDPDGSGNPIAFKLRALTGTEEGNLQQASMSREAWQEITSRMIEAGESGKKLEPDEISAIIAEGMMDQQIDNDALNERVLQKVAIGIKAPKGITVERLRNWNSALIETFSNILDDLSIESAMWTLRSAGVKAIKQ